MPARGFSPNFAKLIIHIAYLKKMAHKIATLGLVAAAALSLNGQTLEKMNWFNEPAEWNIADGKLTMNVTPKSDYWRISHYGFTVDDAPFYYAEYGGEFEAKVKISGNYQKRFDQAGMMIRIDHENYIKTGIEFVDGKYNLSTVVTHHTSDWSVIALLFVRRQDLHHDAQRMDGGQPPRESWHDGSMPRRRRFQRHILRLQGDPSARQSAHPLA